MNHYAQAQAGVVRLPAWGGSVIYWLAHQPSLDPQGWLLLGAELVMVPIVIYMVTQR